MPAIIHVDMDAFFASVEQRDRPELRGLPVLVGGNSRRGVVAAASYEARKFGARSAMSMVQALRLCPQAIVVRPRFSRYSEVSRAVFEIFRRYTPEVEGLSLDEAFLDVTHSRELFGEAEQIAERIRQEIFDELGLTASAGVAPNKFVAKIASDINKPNGLTVVRANEVRAFLAPLPIEKMWGVGPKSWPALKQLGIHRFGDIARTSEQTLVSLFGKWGAEIKKLAQGIDERSVITQRKPKSIGSEHTFDRDLKTKEELKVKILAQSLRVAERLTQNGYLGHKVTLKIKYGDHQLRTRQMTLDEAAADATTIYQAACALLDKFNDLQRGVRLSGVAVSSLHRGDAEQGDLFAQGQQRRQELEEVVVKLRARYGEKGLTRGTLIER